MEVESEVLAETEHFLIFRTDDGEEMMYHVELGPMTLHFMSDEWDELLTLFKEAA